MLSKRKKAKLTDKLHKIKANANFELAVAEAQLADFVSDDSTFEPPSPVDWSMNMLPNIPQPREWTDSEPESILQIPVIISAVDSVIDTSGVAVEKKDCRTSEELETDCELFKLDPIRAEVASMSCAYDPVLFCHLLDEQIALSKFSAAVGSATVRHQDPNSVIDFWEDPAVTNKEACVGASHAEKPKGVDAELLQKI